MTERNPAQMEKDELWQHWSTSREQQYKDELIIRYIPLVEQVAGRMLIGLPNSVELNELVNSGIIGLISAVANFQIEKGIKFETYAIPRVRGSIIDSLREYDWMPRSIRAKSKALENALVSLEGSLGRIPSDEEVANELKLDIDGYYSLMEEVKVASILSLDQPYSSPDGDQGALKDFLEDEDNEDVEGVIVWADAKGMAKKLIKGLSQQERLVISLYYYEELTLREIGEILDISESRVSQIHSKIILTLKGKLRALMSESDD